MHLKCEICGENLSKQATYLVAFFCHDDRGECEDYVEICKSCWDQYQMFTADLKVHG